MSMPLRSLNVCVALCLATVVGISGIVGCGKPDTATVDTANPSATAGKQVVVQVSIVPQRWVVERIGGEHVVVRVLAAQGQDPHVFEPTPRQIMNLGESDVYLTIDMPFEILLLQKLKGAGAHVRFVPMTAGIRHLNFGDHGVEATADSDASPDANDHGDEHDHVHNAMLPDPHVWLAPSMLKTMADNTLKALLTIDTDPAHVADYERNHAALNADLDALDARLRAQLAPYKGQAIYVYHPSFGYFTDAYGLRQKAVEIDGRTPAPKQLQTLVAEALADHAKVIFVQPQFNPASAKLVADAVGGEVVSIDPLAANPLASLELMGNAIAHALGGVGSAPNGRTPPAQAPEAAP